MHRLGWIAPLTLVGACIEILILVVIMRRKLGRNWPSLIAYCAGAVGFDIAFSFGRHSYAVWFWTYWIWTLVASFIQFWIIADVLKSFPGGLVWPKQFRQVLGWFCVLVTVGALVMAMQIPVASNYERFMHTVLTIDACAKFAWAAFFASFLFSIWIMRLGWDAIAAGVANGMAVRSITGLICSQILSTGHHQHLAQTIGAYGALTALILWLHASVQKTDLSDAIAWLQSAKEKHRTVNASSERANG